ncbi:MAG TPA: PqqD family protein [Gaiellaceae bacterium]
MTRRFRVNSPRVMHETIEGEVIVIDLTTGSYYSLRDASAEIWREIESGADEARIGAALEHRYEGPREEILAGVGRLLDELAAEGLIEPSDTSGDGPAPPALPTSAAVRTPFQPPVLEKHSDMQDLILLDPVHEVGPRGWPHAADSAGA